MDQHSQCCLLFEMAMEYLKMKPLLARLRDLVGPVDSDGIGTANVGSPGIHQWVMVMPVVQGPITC